MNAIRRFMDWLMEREYCPKCGAEFFRADEVMDCYDCGIQSTRWQRKQVREAQ